MVGVQYVYLFRRLIGLSGNIAPHRRLRPIKMRSSISGTPKIFNRSKVEELSSNLPER